MKSVTRTVELERVLSSNNIQCSSFHAGLNQTERLSRFTDFKENKSKVLIATDLFARGIDIGKVNVVINYDMPENSDQYLHRVGRAGRFGTKGLTITFVNPEIEKERQVLEEVQKRFEVKIETLPQSIDKRLYM